MNIQSRTGTNETVALSQTPLTLGRSENCDVVLRTGEISREHAQVWLDENGCVFVKDLGSKNGTRVDAGEPFVNAVQPAIYSIRIGEYEIDLTGLPQIATVDATVRFQVDAAPTGDNTHFFPSSRGLDLNQQRLLLLMGLTERIGGAFDSRQLLEQALDACCDALGFERGMIALKTQRGEPEKPITRNVGRDESGAFKISRTLVNRALVHGERAVVNNPAVDLVDNLTESLVRFPICSALCVPIQHRDEIIGVVYGDRITRAATYKTEDVDFFAAIARQVGVGIANLRLFQQQLEAEKVYIELDKARTIQRGLLPASTLQAGRVTLAGHNEPSSTISGDYFDYFELGGGTIAFIIADVTGHGLAAALMMANLQAAVRVALTADIPLYDLATRLNQLVLVNTDSNVFITAIVGRIDTATGHLEYVNAGHPAPLLLRSGGVSPDHDGQALPFGIESDETYVVQSIAPEPDLGAIMFYTDGLTEAADADGRMLDVSPITDTLAPLTSPTVDTVLDTTLKLVRGHLAGAKNADDLTLLAIHYQSAP